MKSVIKGIGVVNATPLRDDGGINFDEYERHIEWLIESGIGFIQPHAATGQGALSTEAEYEELLRFTVKIARGRTPITAYSGRVSTEETIAATRVAAEAGADAAFVMQPWYSKPDEVGLYQHFARVAGSVELPLFIYNNPQRAGVSIPVDTVRRLADEFDNIVGLKQTDLPAIIDSFVALRGRASVSPYGDAELLWGLGMGATWSISYSANVIAPEWVSVFDDWMAGDLAAARETFYKFMPLVRATHLEPIPGPIKYMMRRRGWDFGPSKSPIHDVSEATAQTIDEIMDRLDLR